jgi:hypothetical protein
MGAGPLVVTYPLTRRSRAIVEEELGGTTFGRRAGEAGVSRGRAEGAAKFDKRFHPREDVSRVNFALLSPRSTPSDLYL